MRAVLEEFRNVILSRKYIFHLHTDFSDGMSTVEDYFRYAIEKSCTDIIFTEHVRRNISYDFDRFLSQIHRMKIMFPMINVITGVEAKILPEGELDIPEEVLSKIELICFACHTFPDNVELYERSFKKLFEDTKWKAFTRVWVHPGRYLKRRGLLAKYGDVLYNLLNEALNNDIFIESNTKEALPPAYLLGKLPPDRIIVGCDAHSIEELSRLQERYENDAW